LRNARIGSGQQRAHGKRSGALTEDRYVACIAAKAADVLLHPAQRRHHVHQGIVAGVASTFRCQVLRGQKAKDAQPVVDGHEHDTARHKP
jgi:hypothetical protein